MIKTLAIGHQYQDAFTRARARGSELEFCKKLIDFFDVEPTEDHFIKHYHTNGKLHWIDIKRLPRRMPTLRAFAKKIGVNIQMIYNWLNEKHGSFQQEFLDAFTCAREIRKDWLIDLGLSGLTPPASFKFVAINVTEMRDQSGLNIGGADGEPLLSSKEKTGV